ncbi:MAG: DNA-formamidopyrimidine glycosylase [Acholeplasmataceae bacterium]
MPELPEVETVRRILHKQIENKIIVDLISPYQAIIKNDFLEFKKNILNKTIIAVDRAGKYLIFVLNQGFILIHLRMEGKFYLKPFEEGLDKHEHVIFYLHDQSLRYHDVRKFGTIEYFETKEAVKEYLRTRLGPEPSELEPNYLFEKIKQKKQPIKTTLLDQSVIAGLGNIYVDEVLFLSKIHPLAQGVDLTEDDAKRIVINAKKVIDEAIELGGTTIRSYTASLGVTGRFQTKLKIHLKKGEPCVVCGTIIEKIKVGGRGTYVCQNCQN